MKSSYKFNYITTLIILCAGYFVDFYDLTIFSASYTELIPQQFQIIDPLKIQQLYLTLTNWHNLGIFTGAILFGIMGDKLGRTYIIRFNILFYSSAIIISIFTKSIFIFSILRFITGMGLASEFAISSVLISEIFSVKVANRSAAILYSSGILGGITATFFSVLSWKTMFILGGIAGIIIYVARSKIYESHLFEKIYNMKHITKGKLSEIILNKANLIKTIKLWSIILPFQLLISIMFIFPNFMNLGINTHTAIKILLIGFFSGNLISTFLGALMINWFKNYRIYIIINIILVIFLFCFIGF